MSKHDKHPVHQVEIKGAKVRVICGCGWKSNAAKTETEARKLHARHVGAK